MARSHEISITVEVDEVISELTDDDLLHELSSRGIQGAIIGDALEDLERALRRRDWGEVEHLLLTHVIPRSRSHAVVGRPRPQAAH